jgi:hypothetical protein
MDKYYIAKLIWQIKIPTNNICSEFDEQLRIVKACNAQEAIKKALQIGHINEETFINSKGEHVSWIFINVEFVKEIVSFDDGTEICSQTIKAADASQFIKDIHVKAALNTDAILQKLE